MASGNKDYAPDITFPLTIQQGGTGLTSLTAGEILVGNGTGAVLPGAPGGITTLDVTPTVNGGGVTLHGNTAPGLSAGFNLKDDTAGVERGALGLSAGANNYLTSSVAGDICLRADTGTLRLGTGTTEALAIDQSQNVSMAHPLAVGSGGSGSATPALVAGANIVLSGSWPDETIALAASPSVTSLTLTGSAAPILTFGASNTGGSLTLDNFGNIVAPSGTVATASWQVIDKNAVPVLQIYTDGTKAVKLAGVVSSYNGVGTPSPGLPSIVATLDRTGIIALIGLTAFGPTLNAAFYRLSWEIFATAGGVIDTLYFTLNWVQNGVTVSQSSPTLSINAGTKAALGGVICLFADAASSLSYTTSTPGTAPTSYDLHFRLEAL